MTHRNRYSAEDRALHIERWQQSGLTRARYCREAGIAYYLLSDWLRAGKRRSLQHDKPQRQSAGGFVRMPIPPASRQDVGPVLRVDGVGALSIAVYAGCDVAMFEQVLKAVR